MNCNLTVSFPCSSMRVRQEVLLEWTLMFFQSGRRASQAKELWYPYWMMVSHTHMLSFMIQFFEYLTYFYVGISFVFCKKPKQSIIFLSSFVFLAGVDHTHPDLAANYVS